MTVSTQAASDQVLQLQHSLAWALGVIKSAPAAADLCPWHGRVPFPHSCGYYQNAEWNKAIVLLQAPMLDGTWMWNTQIALPPNSGDLRSDTGKWQDATVLNLDYRDKSAADQSLGLQQSEPGCYIKLTHGTDPTRWAQYLVTAQETLTATYYAYPVSLFGSAGSIPNSGTNIRVQIAEGPLP